MKTSNNYRYKAASILKLYRWKCNFYKKHTVVDYGVYDRIYRYYKQVCVLYNIGLISDSCANRAFSMSEIIRQKYYRGVNNGCIK